jgi:hypothetical protein
MGGKACNDNKNKGREKKEKNRRVGKKKGKTTIKTRGKY